MEVVVVVVLVVVVDLAQFSRVTTG